MLVAADAINPARSQALGDVAHRTTLYIEVPTPGIRVDLYDPGLFDPARGGSQLDVNVGSPPQAAGQIRYVLKDPTGGVAADVTYGADTPATDRTLVPLFADNRAATGIWQLDVSLLDGVPAEQDVAVFGVSVPGRQVFTYNLTAGQANQGGAAITEPLVAFPWLVQASAGADAIGPVCGASFISYDLDAELDGMGDPVPPPSTDVTTRRGYAFPAGDFPPSGDARWTHTRMNGLPYGFLDSNDQGIWEWAFSDLTVPEDAFGAAVPALDLNAFSIQILDRDAAPRDTINWPSVPPFGDGSPRRIYLPEDDGTAPRRAWLGHSAEITAGFPVIAQGQVSTLDVTIELGNPHAFDLTGVAGESHVTPDPQVGDPVLVGSTGGLTATVTGRRIDFSGDVPAGTVATVTYRVVVTPTALGREFLTGDDASFVSTAPTIATYDTPYLPSLGFRQEMLGPACEIEYESVVPGCVAAARLVAERVQACPGTDILLDASTSQVANCPGVIAFQWSVNGSVVEAFPGASSRTVTPIFDDTWSVEVACSTDLNGCNDVDEVTFQLYPGVDVAVTASPSPSCAGDAITVDAAISAGTPPYVNGRWSTTPPGEPGDGSTALPLPVAPTRTTTYEYLVEDALGCSGRGETTVTIDVPSPVLSPGSIELCPGESATLSADAGWASYLWSTAPVDPAVEGATTPDVSVSRVGTTYTVTVTNAAGCTGGASLLPTAAPALTPAIVPAAPRACPGEAVTLSAPAGMASYLWTTSPLDAAVEGATTPDVSASVTGTRYTVTVTDARGCSGSAGVVLGALSDPTPGPVGGTLRVRKSAPDVLLSWLDIPDPASGYEVVFLECATRDWRASCGGAIPGVDVTAALTPVIPGAQAAVHAGAFDLGDMIFYLVRALSPCSDTPGPMN